VFDGFAPGLGAGKTQFINRLDEVALGSRGPSGPSYTVVTLCDAGRTGVRTCLGAGEAVGGSAPADGACRGLILATKHEQSSVSALACTRQPNHGRFSGKAVAM
jgi:hypothetical protein